MAEERMRVLDMVREGKITAEEGARLLEALSAGAGTGTGTPAGAGRAERAPGAPSPGWGGKGGDDPIGSIANTVVEMLQKSGLGNWAGRGGWSGGTLQGKERRQQREADGWQAVPLSEGDHGTFELPPGVQLTVETDAGGIEARASDAGPARLTLEGEDLSNYAVYAVRKGQEVVLSSYRTEHFARLPRLVLDVPRDIARLTLRTSGGSLNARGFACPVTLRTSGGGIHVKEQGAGAVEAKTSGGGIHVEGRPATVDLNTSGGGIHFKGQTEAFQAKTSGGSISLDGVRLVSGEHRAKTAGGSIKVRLTADSSVDVSAQTSAGHLSMDLPGIKGEQSGPRMSPRYRGTYNSGAARLDLSTAAGSVSVGLSDEPGEGAPSPSPSPSVSAEPAPEPAPEPDVAPETHQGKSDVI
jgi:hypothetical protein